MTKKDRVMNKQADRLRMNINVAKAIWGRLSKTTLDGLKELTVKYAFSVVLGDLQLLECRWYVTHSGLLSLAARDRCHGIHVQQVRAFCDPVNCRWVFKALVYKSPRSKGFVGYGDADPSNVSFMVHGAEMRIAETRAVNRALRKAYGIGICSVEEIGALDRQSEPAPESKKLPQGATGNGHGNRTVGDRLCQIIRQHHLNP